VLPLPSWPTSFTPQQATVESARSAQPWPEAIPFGPNGSLCETVIPITSDNGSPSEPPATTWTGTSLAPSTSAPSCPKMLVPQHSTVPDATSAQAWWSPAATAATPASGAPSRPSTGVGTRPAICGALPQHVIVESDLSAHV
jgi:hypothetical protein